ncbi:Hypothetical protein PBC10988_29430 [Planctomycetales bacterium 10988]|nr:Hypothetical protein PBC10988_29430 [Planctomycetales bacterium 10988]
MPTKPPLTGWAYWKEKWETYVGDRDLELAIRKQLREESYGSELASIRHVRLAAVERPGWVQVYEFQIETKTKEKTPVLLFGLAHDDGRKQTKVRLFPTEEARKMQFDQWSEGLITRKRRERGRIEWALLSFFALIMGVCLLGILLR